MIEGYDPEFGPNRVLKCSCCGARLMVLEICWCLGENDDA